MWHFFLTIPGHDKLYIFFVTKTHHQRKATTMSLATSTFQAFRSCTASLSARSLARPAVVRCPARMSRLRVRCYSEVTSNPEPEETKAEEQPNKSSEMEGKLKEKENEVVDLTVCANLSMSNRPFTESLLGSSALSSS